MQTSRAVVSSPGANFHTVFPALGTTVEVRSQGPADPDLVAHLQAEVERYESAWSKFRPDSEVCQLNQAAGSNRWIPVSDATRGLLLTSMELSRQTGMFFRPTIGALSQLWQVKPWLAQIAAGLTPKLPTAAEVEEARQASALDNLLFDGASSFQLRRGASIDLGGVAKGWIADALRDLMKAAGRQDVLVSIGSSSLAAAGSSPAQRPWKVGIAALTPKFAQATGSTGQAAGSTGQAVAGTATLLDASLATSGDNLQQLPTLWEGQKVHHLVDPSTGYPSQSQVRQASVIARNGVVAEILASTLVVTGDPGSLQRRLPQADFHWMLVTDEEVTTSEGWPR
ncbi:MAG: FAD:protein FMN transferase [Actinomycetaceae bacterium]|nr:FAD:protein FMN transferase [Actinomycetaceae bacterium]